MHADDAQVEDVELAEPAEVEEALSERGLFDGCLAVAAPPGTEVCEACFGARSSPFGLCHSCRRVSRALRRPLVPLTPISLTKRGSALYSALKQYKGKANALSRRQQVRLSGLIAAFVERHLRCVAPEGFDAVVVVPSRLTPTDVHDQPLATTIAMVPTLAAALVPALSSGPGLVGRNSPCADAYTCVREHVEGRRVLLVDDTYTTGAHMQSAASVLAGCGATRVDLLVVGRYQNPSWPPARWLLEWAARSENRWELASCVHCRAKGAGR